MVVNVQWDSNPASDGVVNYNLSVDNQAPVSIPTGQATIKVPITVAPGPHTVKVSASYLLLSGDPTSLVEGPQASASFTVNNGGNVINLKVTK